MSAPLEGRRIRLVAVEEDLAGHVVDLLGVAGIDAERQRDGGLTEILISPAEEQRARATLDLVLPGLLAEESGELLATEEPGDRQPLSGRLIRRSDWTSEPTADKPEDAAEPWLQDGRAAFLESVGRGSPAPPEEPDTGDDFVPPEPPPIPRAGTATRFAWLGAIGGPILLVLAAILSLPSPVAVLGLAGFVIGFGVLVARSPDRARQDDGWDDGAVL